MLAGLGAGAAWALTGCGTDAKSGLSSTTTQMIRAAAAQCPAGSDFEAIEHVVILCQENRSFDHYFGAYPGVRGFDDRTNGAESIFAQAWPGGATPTLLPYPLAAALPQVQCDGNSDIPIHEWQPQHMSWNNGKMDGFVSAHIQFDGADQAPLVMGHYTRSDLPFYYALADEFTICDSYHCSVIGPTMPNRMYLMSGMIDPTGAGGGPVVTTPGFDTAKAAVASVEWETMPEILSDKGVSWKIYQPPNTSVGSGIDLNLALGFNNMLYFKQYVNNPTTDLYKQAFLPSWPNEFAADVKAGTLPSVSWMIPPLADSEHPNSPPDNGEWYVSQILSTLVSNPDVWSKTVVFLVYDENGGFFDHVAPPVAPPGTPGEYLTVNPLPSLVAGQAGPIGLGFRVPAMVISPFSRGGWVNSDMFDHTSVLQFLEKRFDVVMPNITKWRRDTVGDLTSTLDLKSPDPTYSTLPATQVDNPANGAYCPEPNNIAPFLGKPEPIAVPANIVMPTQEPGTAKRRDCEPAKK
jgi:phospholipase C